jgi:type I restriction enzyme S subunit
MKRQAYTNYKSSGVEWLGDVPEHWEVKRLKYSATINDDVLSESTPDDFEFEYVDISSVNAVDGITTKERLLFENAPSRARRKVRQGDTIVSTVRTYLRAIAPIKEHSDNLIVSTGFAVIRPRKIDAGFLAYTLRESSFVESVVSRSTGVSYPAVNSSEVGGIAIPLPSSIEQQEIEKFLDLETGRIDQFVAKKRELIERLKEKRTALISRTVTRGLPPDAARAAGVQENPALKPSGIKWLGDIPAHWATRRLRHISDFITVGVVVNPSSYVTDEGVPFLLGGDVREFNIITNNCKYCSKESSDGPLRKSRLQADDVVIVRVGYPGIAAVVPWQLDGANCASMVLVRKHKRYCSQWLAYMLNSQVGRDQISIVQYGAAQKQFNISHAVDFSFPFPTLHEQVAITAYLDDETAKLDALMEKLEEAIDRLQEYRTALITAAVTGKIDIRKSQS